MNQSVQQAQPFDLFGIGARPSGHVALPLPARRTSAVRGEEVGMRRFVFHICDGVDVRGEKDVLLDGVDEARVLAVSRCLKDLGRRRRSRTEWAVQVTNEQGTTICKLNFFGHDLGEAVEPP